MLQWNLWNSSVALLIIKITPVDLALPNLLCCFSRTRRCEPESDPRPPRQIHLTAAAVVLVVVDVVERLECRDRVPVVVIVQSDLWWLAPGQRLTQQVMSSPPPHRCTVYYVRFRVHLQWHRYWHQSQHGPDPGINTAYQILCTTNNTAGTLTPVESNCFNKYTWWERSSGSGFAVVFLCTTSRNTAIKVPQEWPT